MTDKRIEKVFTRDEKVEAVFITKKENVRYLSNFKGDESFLLLTRDKKKYLLTDFRYVEQAKKEASEFEIIDYKGKLYEAILDILSQNHINSLYFEGYNLTFSTFSDMKEKIGDRIYPLSFSIDEIRAVKDEEEIELIKRAVEITDKAFEHILKFIKPGVTENEVVAELNHFILKNGAKGFSFEPIVASGKRSSLPHGTATNKKIEYGDVVTIDFGCNFDGYMSDMTRTIFVGKPDDSMIRIYNIVKEAQQKAEEFIKEGIKCLEVDKIARDYIGSFGYMDKFGHSLGHGVGLEIHELPRLSPKSEAILKENMVVTVEPGIYLKEVGGVRIEDLVVVKKNGCEILTGSTKEIIIL
ncbi:peptidase M24 [Caldicellulosiruptor saccharolyticus DSM 8903]|uniref:Peptidase M24 n=1 Tax=Caldicellulosiruptor saccharolyticus (strain ATCC 43494 / DSM 8903 / Tp8T 6331) TaxID=351627 RepID=A4XLN0_CALS8|nr:aminopeptidase P family protein [Caldicellulosiruptor saccharolyticus]ABP67815.1 peptidase M24 [Caldicellulosiruptor saccharolyticus DSM 8903]